MVVLVVFNELPLTPQGDEQIRSLLD